MLLATSIRPTKTSKRPAGTRLAMMAPSGAASSPPITRPITAVEKASGPSWVTKLTEIAIVTKNSAVFTVPMVVRGEAP